MQLYVQRPKPFYFLWISAYFKEKLMMFKSVFFVFQKHGNTDWAIPIFSLQLVQSLCNLHCYTLADPGCLFCPLWYLETDVSEQAAPILWLEESLGSGNSKSP